VKTNIAFIIAAFETIAEGQEDAFFDGVSD
jgi:hypothetical protein